MNDLTILVYDHVGSESELQIDREPDEDDESYARRVELYRILFERKRIAPDAV